MARRRPLAASAGAQLVLVRAATWVRIRRKPAAPWQCPRSCALHAAAAPPLTLGGGIGGRPEGQHLEVKHLLWSRIQQLPNLPAAAAGRAHGRGNGSHSAVQQGGARTLLVANMMGRIRDGSSSNESGCSRRPSEARSSHATCVAHLASGSHSGPPSMMTSREAVGTCTVVEPCLQRHRPAAGDRYSMPHSALLPAWLAGP